MAERGYFGIGIIGGKMPRNAGTLWRSAANFGVSFIFTVACRYERQPSDTEASWRHVPLFEYEHLHELTRPRDCTLVAVEQTARAESLSTYVHPERAIYLLGAEDTGIPGVSLEAFEQVVQIETPRCINVAVAGSIVMYDRVAKGRRATAGGGRDG